MDIEKQLICETLEILKNISNTAVNKSKNMTKPEQLSLNQTKQTRILII